MGNQIKREAIRQVEEIHNSLLESEKFMPYNFNAVILWGVISIILFVSAQHMFKLSIVYGTLFLTIILGFGGLFEYFLTKKENKKYDFIKFTKIQKFVETVFRANFIFGILISIVLVLNNLISYIYVIWMFIIGISGFVVGYTISSRLFLLHGKYTVLASLVLFGLTIFLGADHVSFVINQIFAILFLGIGYIYLGVRLKKECKGV
ncbi:hypothetical protein KKG72_08530 [bacterium]|nr:hypothetical protein [bacterium]MBU1995188.1 hypothetical protein [bacterium]